MEDKRGPNIRGRQLGERLLRRMAERNWGVREMSRKLDMSAQWVSSVTRGLHRPDPVHLARFLTILGFRGAEYRELMALGEEIRKPGLLESYAGSWQVQTLAWHEERATEIAAFQGVILPGLLHTADYARCLMVETGNVASPDGIDERVFARMARQLVLTRRPMIEFRFFIHEFALRLPVGREDRSVMRGQLAHLLRVSAQPNVSIRVVPARIGGHPAISGHFKLIESTEFEPVVYIDQEISSLFLEAPDEIAVYRQVVARLGDAALDSAQSEAFIADLAE
ncbi:helix-turn-helix domain-containing protein [Amycolatopsis sp. NPDC098790]|uniref:helix-turn-helix domain-containing protein n=1 Tax=Amycolatopsis sp. NPDC098790 TaxID=3363939 RepID=UPI00381137B4